MIKLHEKRKILKELDSIDENSFYILSCIDHNYAYAININFYKEPLGIDKRNKKVCSRIKNTYARSIF